MASGNGRTPLFNLEAEASVLGAMFLSADAAGIAMKLVRADEFFKPAHKAIFNAATECFSRGEGVDVVTVAHRLETTGLLDFVGDKEALLGLQNDVPTIGNVTRYIDIITDHARRRGVEAMGMDLIDAAHELTKPLERIYEMMSPPADVELGNRYEKHSYNAVELMNMPPPSWLIDSTIPNGSLAVTYGPPKSAKTFLALHEALCVATGLAVFGNRVQRRRRVVYVVAEGAAGFGRRIRAWCEWHHHDPDDLPGWIRFIDVAVNLLDRSAVRDLADLCEADEAGLCVIDTVARCMVGADENSGRDMGQVVEAMDEIRATGPAVLGIHHTGKSIDQGMRGHSSLFGAVDTAIEVIGDRNSFKVTMTAQKDAEPTPAWWGKLIGCAGSVVIQPAARPEDDDGEASRDTLAESISELLAANREVLFSGRDVTDALKGSAHVTKLRAALKWLVVNEYVEESKRPGTTGSNHRLIRPYFKPAPTVELDDEPF